jgi:hypothetical protein
MDINTRIKMRSKARLTKGLMNILSDDVERICNEVDDCDVVNLKDSIEDAKGTLQCLLDNIVELEYTVYLSKRGMRE